eukprot:scaffold10676_cov15-Prasinocladus_malaysianus.AAC.1
MMPGLILRSWGQYLSFLNVSHLICGVFTHMHSLPQCAIIRTFAITARETWHYSAAFIQLAGPASSLRGLDAA